MEETQRNIKEWHESSLLAMVQIDQQWLCSDKKASDSYKVHQTNCLSSANWLLDSQSIPRELLFLKLHWNTEDGGSNTIKWMSQQQDSWNTLVRVRARNHRQKLSFSMSYHTPLQLFCPLSSMEEKWRLTLVKPIWFGTKEKVQLLWEDECVAPELTWKGWTWFRACVIPGLWRYKKVDP